MRTKSPRGVGAADAGPLVLDRAWSAFLRLQGDRFATAQLTLPTGTGTLVRIRSWARDASHHGARDEFRIDAVTGQVTSSEIYADKSTGERILASVLDIHRGSIFGWPGKLLFMSAAALMPLFAWSPASCCISRAENIGVHRDTRSGSSFRANKPRPWRTTISVWPEVISPQFFTLDAAKGAIRKPLVGHPIIDDANRKPVTHIGQNADAFDRFASGPTPGLLQTITREVGAADCHGMFQETHQRFAAVRYRPVRTSGNFIARLFFFVVGMQQIEQQPLSHQHARPVRRHAVFRSCGPCRRWRRGRWPRACRGPRR